MSSDLYWRNLGISYPEPFRQAIVHNSYEIVNYLKRAEVRLSQRKYVFTFNVQEIVIRPSNSTLLELLRNTKTIYFDALKRQKLNPNSIIDPKQMLISLNSPMSEWFLYVDANGQTQKVQVQVYRVILANLEPAEVSEEEEDLAVDLLFDQSEYVYDSPSNSFNNGIRILDRSRNESTLTLADLPKIPRIVVRYNTYVMRRECQALETLALHPKKHHLPLLNLLLRTLDATWDEVNIDQSIRYRVLTDTSKAGTDEQREFVRKALGTPDIAILEGPPGSGKTTTILEIILQLLPQRKRVLLVASTHVAVDNVIEKLIETSVDGKTLIEKYGVVPLRVGSKDDISEKVLKYHIDNFVESERKRLLEFLGKQPKRTNSQNILYESLSSETQGRTIVENMALESANLVCGTTIGILQSKFIKESKEAKPAFDYLILDEASKTTFQEFLVPALHASRWILSGDIKQLSPYVDQVPIRENLANLPSLSDEIGKEDKRVCVDVFKATTKRGSHESGTLVVYADESDLPRRYDKQAKAVEKTLYEDENERKLIALCIVSGQPNTIAGKLEIMGSKIVLVSKSQLRVLENVLLPHLQPNQFVSETFSRRRKAFLSHHELKGFFEHSQNSQLWEDEVAWRISRLYELRNLKERQDIYLRELRLLLPHFERTDRLLSGNAESCNVTENAQVRLPRDEFALIEIRRIERIALPSVLELLQKGYKQTEGVNEEARIPLYNGLPENVLKQRYTMLVYQHRMHPEISKFPRENLYSNEALKDSPDLQRTRSWNYRFYANKSVWVNVNPTRNDMPERGSRSNYNLAELKVVSSHLKSFMDWSQQHPSEENGSEGYWTVALLSFYKGQANKLAEMMRQMFGSRNRGYFESRPHNLKVQVCTVDRFQGHEADMVLLSLVNARRKIGFLDNPNRLNVALTRAKYQLVIVGDRATFRNEEKSTDLLRNLEKVTPEGTIKFDVGQYDNPH